MEIKYLYLIILYYLLSKNKYDSNLSKMLYNDDHIEYHIEFFIVGINAIIKKWLYNGCKENSEEINQILIEEYQNKNINY